MAIASRTLSAASVAVLLAALGLACAPGGAPVEAHDAAACPDLGHPCERDEECCTEHCVLEGEEAYCQVAPGRCVGGGLHCTESAQCCGKNCVDGACSLQPSCQPVGGACSFDTSCCSGSCVDGACRAAAGPPPIPQCAAPGAACASDAECCLRRCVDNACAVVVADGGTGGSSCAPPGGFCRIGADCCSQQCEATSGSGICR